MEHKPDGLCLLPIHPLPSNNKRNRNAFPRRDPSHPSRYKTALRAGLTDHEDRLGPHSPPPFPRWERVGGQLLHVDDVRWLLDGFPSEKACPAKVKVDDCENKIETCLQDIS